MPEQYIIIKELFNDIEGETKKAFCVKGVWIPKSQGYIAEYNGRPYLYIKKWLSYEIKVRIHQNEESRKIRKMNEILS